MPVVRLLVPVAAAAALVAPAPVSPICPGDRIRPTAVAAAPRPEPTARTVNGSRVMALSAGYRHTCALTTGGSVSCWGFNDSGRLGDGTDINSSRPHVVKGLNHVTAISAGGGHTCAVTADRVAFCWGYGGDGRLGDGTMSTSFTPVRVKGLNDVTAISAGGSHTCAIAGGKPYCWGSNMSHNLGDGPDAAAPKLVTGLTGTTTISAGMNHTCAVAGQGQVYCWGDNEHRQAGVETTWPQNSLSTPTPVVGATGITQVTAGFRSTCGRRAGGEILCWGDGGLGAFGNGATPTTPVPTVASGFSGTVGIGMGDWHACAIAPSRTVLCSGSNSSGALGSGTSQVFVSSPVKVSALRDISSLSVGAWHACAAASTGRTYCWGANGDGQLGDGTAVDAVTPVAVLPPGQS